MRVRDNAHDRTINTGILMSGITPKVVKSVEAIIVNFTKLSVVKHIKFLKNRLNAQLNEILSPIKIFFD